VHIIHYHWPDFNVADSAIVVGAILLMLDALFSGKEQTDS
jgi:signal peptidase II